MNSKAEYKIYPLGENALTVDFGNEISVELNEKVCALAEILQRRRIGGVLEILPAYSSLTIFYDIEQVRKNFPDFANAFEAVSSIIVNIRFEKSAAKTKSARTHRLPVDFSEKYALDLTEIAEQANLTVEKFIDLFVSNVYRVFMLGFTPGFAYLGEVDETLAAPRRSSPRLLVPAGSVGIAGRQTGIYPFDSPGGWQIIGRTKVKLFDAADSQPCLFRAGDAVEFYSV